MKSFTDNAAEVHHLGWFLDCLPCAQQARTSGDMGTKAETVLERLEGSDD